MIVDLVCMCVYLHETHGLWSPACFSHVHAHDGNVRCSWGRALLIATFVADGDVCCGWWRLGCRVTWVAEPASFSDVHECDEIISVNGVRFVFFGLRLRVMVEG